MSTTPSLRCSVAAALCLALVGTAIAVDWSGIVRDAVDTTKKVADEAQKKKNPAAQPATSVSQQNAAATASPAVRAQPAGGLTVFSTEPLDAAKPGKGVTSFKAGDHIYGLMQAHKPWRDLFSAKDKSELPIPIQMTIDNNPNTLFQYITLTTAALIDGTNLVLDIAPEPDKMTAYMSPDMSFPDCMGSTFGPLLFSKKLGGLTPGTHTMKFQVYSFGKVFSSGQFTIDGTDYSFYAGLCDKLSAVRSGTRTMPAPGQTNKDIEADVRKLCENAGWKNIAKLVIVDKDWWLDRVDGGDTPIKSRRMDAAVAAKADDGTYYYCIVSFEQQRLLDGSYGKSEIIKTGARKVIAEEHIGK